MSLTKEAYGPGTGRKEDIERAGDLTAACMISVRPLREVVSDEVQKNKK
jgi:hypothetical protein